MNGSSVISLQIHSFTFIASYTGAVLRISLEINHHEEVLYQAPKFSSEYFPQQLQILFENVEGFYSYLYKLAAKNMAERITFSNGLLKIKVFIDDKMKQIPIKMKKMIEQKLERDPKDTHHPFMLTSISSEAEEQRESRASSNFLAKIEKEGYSGPRVKLMMMRENNKMKKALTKVPQISSSSVTHNVREYPYLKPQTIHRYDKFKTEEHTPAGRKSQSQGKTLYNYRSKSLNLRKNMKENNLDLSNKDLKISDIKDLVGYDWSRLILLNLGYNNIGTEGLKYLTSIAWPTLKTLYVCFNNIYRIDWTPTNISFLKTLSLSTTLSIKAEQDKRNPKEYHRTVVSAVTIYIKSTVDNNKIEMIPQQLALLEELKNLSIYGNKIDPSRNKKVLQRLKSRKVQVWE